MERFEYFRQLSRIAGGEDTIGKLLAAQERYDTYFVDSPGWRDTRGR